VLHIALLSAVANVTGQTIQHRTELTVTTDVLATVTMFGMATIQYRQMSSADSYMEQNLVPKHREWPSGAVLRYQVLLCC
jgi:hypothetical protein